MLRGSTSSANCVLPPAPVGALQRSAGEPAKDHDNVPAREDFARDGKQTWRCLQCGTAITSEHHRRSVAGQDRHRHVNPLGITYEFESFAHAPGCHESGAATSEHSWFAGHRWRVSACVGCNHHLGWRFFTDDDSFYGLITRYMQLTGNPLH